MSPSLSGIFTRALSFDDKEEREHFLRQSCGTDTDLLAEVCELLDASEQSSDSLMRPFSAIPKLETDLPDTDEILPRKFGNYRLEEKIGEGGMGVVYRATQTDLQRQVAIKMVRNGALATRQEIERFFIEARSAAALDHAGIVSVFESGKEDGQHFFSMAHVDGISLSEVVRDHSLSLKQVLSLFIRMCRAVAYAHSRGVIHRDLKPENILISPRGDDPGALDYFLPQILDFGLAKRTNQATDLTLDGELLGTPDYMSPEQAGAEQQITEASDIYSLGALLFFLLVKDPPFKGKHVWEVLNQVRSSPPPRPSDLRPYIPKDLETICLKCLEKKATARYSSVDNLLEDLENFQNGRPIEARPTGRAKRFYKFCRRNPIQTIATILGGALAIALVIFPLKLMLSREVIEKQDELIAFSTRESFRQEAHNHLLKARQHIDSRNYLPALEEFIDAANLAMTADDEQTEHSARMGITASSSKLWQHEGTVEGIPNPTRIKLSPGGGLLAMSGADGELKVIDLRTKDTLLETKIGQTTETFAFHPSEEFFVATTGFQEVTRWKRNPDGFTPDKILNLSTFRVRPESSPISLGFSFDGRVLFTVAQGNHILLWDFETFDAHREPLRCRQTIRFSSFASEANLLISGSENGLIYGWDISTGSRKFGPINLGTSITGFEVDPQGENLIVYPEEEPGEQIYKLSDCHPKTSRLDPFLSLDHQKRAHQPQFGRKTRRLFFAGQGGPLQVADPGNPRPHPIPLFNKNISTFALSFDEQSLVTSSPNNPKFDLWKAPSLFKNTLSFPATGSQKFFIPRYDRPIVATQQYKIRLGPSPATIFKDPRTHFRWSYTAAHGSVISTVVDSTSETLYCLGKSEQEYWLSIVGLSHQVKQKPLRLPLVGTPKLIISPNDKTLAIFSTGTEVNTGPNLAIYHIEQKRLETFTIPDSQLECGTYSSLDPNELVVAASNNLIWVNIHSGEIQRTRSDPGSPVMVLDCSPERECLLLGMNSGVISVFQEGSWQLVGSNSHSSRVHLAKFVNDGAHVASGGLGESVLVWDADSGLSIGGTLSHQSSITSLEVSDETGHIITISSDGECKFWPAPSLDDRNLETIENEARQRFSLRPREKPPQLE